MKRTAVFAATLASLVSLGAVAATGAAPGADQGPRHMKLDTNGDGAIDRNEAAADPRLAKGFDTLDRDGDGRLTKGERPQRMHRDGPHHRGGIARLDADGDGRISKAELGDRGAMAKDFAAIDSNRDGYIVRSEVNAWEAKQRPIREQAREAKFAATFAAADLNGDGKLSKVEASEKMPRMAKRFAWMDDNRDGFLSRAELSARDGRR